MMAHAGMQALAPAPAHWVCHNGRRPAPSQAGCLTPPSALGCAPQGHRGDCPRPPPLPRHHPLNPTPSGPRLARQEGEGILSGQPILGYRLQQALQHGLQARAHLDCGLIEARGGGTGWGCTRVGLHEGGWDVAS